MVKVSMKQIEKVNVRQMTIFVVLFFIGTTILVQPSTLASIAKQNAWIAVILGVFVSLWIVWLYSRIAMIFPDKNFSAGLEWLLGKWIGKLVSILYIFYFICVSADLLSIIGNFFTTQMIPETPAVAIHVVFMTVIAFGVRLGIKTLARSAEIFFVVFFFLFFIIVFTLFPELEIDKIQPVLEQGIKPTIHAMLTFISGCSLTMFTFLYILSSINNAQAIQKSLMKGTIIGGIVMLIITALCILVLGSFFTERNIYPTYVLAKKISIGNLERIEVIIAGMWMITILFKASLYFYALMMSIKQMFRLTDYRPVVLPISMITVVLSLIIFPNYVYMSYFNTTVWIPYVLTLGFVVLFLVWIIGKRKQIRENKKGLPRGKGLSG